jgi:hypothetical protein
VQRRANVNLKCEPGEVIPEFFFNSIVLDGALRAQNQEKVAAAPLHGAVMASSWAHKKEELQALGPFMQASGVG